MLTVVSTHELIMEQGKNSLIRHQLFSEQDDPMSWHFSKLEFSDVKSSELLITSGTGL